MKEIHTLVEDLTEEIRARRKLLSEMVGSLYPRIIEAEIEKLQNAREALK